MAIFPDIETSRNALIKLLKGPSYCDLRLEQLSDKYDEENKEEHRRMLQSISKLDLTKKIKDLTPEEFEKLRITMERIEGWEIGRDDFIEKCYISGVHKKRGVIQEYLIKEGSKENWISKEKLNQACGFQGLTNRIWCNSVQFGAIPIGLVNQNALVDILKIENV